MKSNDKTRNGVELGNRVPAQKAMNASPSHFTQAIANPLKFSTSRRRAFYLVLTKGWFPSLTLSLLTTILGIMG
ncbi:MAG TPA: hypothetical protein V6C91_15995, partial [Coleofasciculaceae cyanobacterium]